MRFVKVEFAPFATLRGSSTGVAARLESLPLATKRLGDFVRGRMGEARGRRCSERVELSTGCLSRC